MNKTQHQKLAKELFFMNGEYRSNLVRWTSQDISWLSQYDGETSSERVWNVFHKRPKCHCGKLTNYIDFASGYRKTCSVSCGQLIDKQNVKKKESNLKYWNDSAWKEQTAKRMREAHFVSRTPKKIKRLLNEKQIVCLDELTPGQNNNYRWQHACGEVFVRSFNRTSGIYCPKCHVSKGQGELYELVRRTYDRRIIVNDRHQIWPKEIDIYLPEIKLGFEFNGKYWHRGEGIREAEKVFEAGEVGIKLVNVWESEWIKNRKLVEAHVVKMIKDRS